MTLDFPRIVALYQAGDHAEVRRLTHLHLAEAPLDEGAVIFAALAAAQLGRAAEYGNILQYWTRAGQDETLLCDKTLQLLLRDRDYEVLIATSRIFPEENRLWIIALYYRGCALMMLERIEEAVEHFSLFRVSVARFMPQIDFAGNMDLNRILRHGRLIADPGEIRRRMELRPAVPELVFLGEAKPAPVVVLASGNSLYFRRLARDFVAGMAALGGSAFFHLNLIDPDDEAMELAYALLSEYPDSLGISVESEPPFRTVTYHACNRFFVADRVMDRYQAPVLAFDLDSLPVEPAEFFLSAASDHDFCCFSTERDEPAGVMAGGVIYCADTLAARLFLERLRRFCWAELDNPSRVNWLLDQAALFSMLKQPMAGLPLSFGDFRELAGREIGDCLRDLCDEATRTEMKNQVALAEPTVARL